MNHQRVFLYVQHLLGIGHLTRTASLARALAAKGHDVTLASGGFAVPQVKCDGVRFVQLPPARAADSSFKVLLDAQGRPIDAAWKASRREILLESWRVADPHALVTELFPFGRRQMRFELIPLLDLAVAGPRRPLIISSVRDVLGGGQRDPARQDEMLELFERYFDHLLVHGDARIIPFDTTFRHAARIESKLHYTGYIVDRSNPLARPDESSGKNEVIVSAGGGAVGRRLLETAIHARRLGSLADHHWRVLAGTRAANSDFEALAELAKSVGQGKVSVERSRDDFVLLLANCALSISQGGYNTVMELIHARAPAVVVPFAGQSETEQTLRAREFAARGLFELVEEPGLSAQTLAAAIERAVVRPRPTGGGVNLDGAESGASLLASWLQRKPC